MRISRDAGELVVTAPGVKATLWRVDFIKEHITVVHSSENKGKTLASHNIVRSKTRLGRAQAGALRMPAPADGMGCAIIAQKSPSAPILAAAYCPGSAASS